MLPTSTAVLYLATGLGASGSMRCSSWMRVSGLAAIDFSLVSKRSSNFQSVIFDSAPRSRAVRLEARAVALGELIQRLHHVVPAARLGVAERAAAVWGPAGTEDHRQVDLVGAVGQPF